MTTIHCTYRGLAITADVDHDPGYHEGSCGGVPETWHVDIDEVEIEDHDEFESHCLLEDYAEAVEQMVNALHRMRDGKLLPHVLALVLREWGEGIAEAAIERYA